MRTVGGLRAICPSRHHGFLRSVQSCFVNDHRDMVRLERLSAIAKGQGTAMRLDV